MVVVIDKDVKGMRGVVRKLDRMKGATKSAEYKAGLRDIGFIAHRGSVQNAPRSPSKAQYKTTLKTPRGKAKSVFRATPGGIENSIKFAVDTANRYVRVFVPLNSIGGQYAKKMHDGRGKSWKNRGVGTKSKGPRAREKFISRAILKGSTKFLQILTIVYKKLIRS